MKPKYLPFNIHAVPREYGLIEAYSNGDTVFIPVDVNEEENHNCDFNGCGSVNHVRRFELKEVGR